MGGAAEMPAGSWLFGKADLVSEKGAGRKNAQIIGEVAVRGDVSQPRCHWKR